MADIGAALAEAWRSTSSVELVAALLAVVYLVLAIEQRLSCWAAAFVSSCLYVWVLFGARLYMESLLNAFFAAMAIYGHWQWQRGVRGDALRVTRWPMSLHGLGFLAVLVLSVINSFFLRRFTPAAWPLVDSLVAWASVFATFLVARKVYENWHWWLVIDAVSVYLYFTRHLYVTMALYIGYLFMIVVGMREWRRDLRPATHASQHA